MKTLIQIKKNFNNLALPNSQYCIASEIKPINENNPASTFTLFHANCRSIEANFNSLMSTIASLKINVSVIAVSETWTNSSNENLISIPGYDAIFNSRIDRTGGGVGLFLNDSLSYVVRSDLQLLTDKSIVECVFVELIHDNVLLLVVCSGLQTVIWAYSRHSLIPCYRKLAENTRNVI